MGSCALLRMDILVVMLGLVSSVSVRRNGLGPEVQMANPGTGGITS